jgi:hypothetical protein
MRGKMKENGRKTGLRFGEFGRDCDGLGKDDIILQASSTGAKSAS